MTTNFKLALLLRVLGRDRNVRTRQSAQLPEHAEWNLMLYDTHCCTAASSFRMM
jgi:hypothetical protein